ncbi:MAG: calcium/sodium antiporter [Bacteroidales bacterium]|nr:calcium/sodium antiporter [Bacteroidales bacterium]
MIVKLLLLILGLALVVLGADILVDGSSSIARRLGISDFVIGLTVVGFGTSLPELVVSVLGALQGNSDIAIGNVVGSNVFNVLLILAVSALVRPIEVTRTNHRRDIPLTLAVTLLLIFTGMNRSLLGLGAADGLSRLEGGIFVALFAAYLAYSFVKDNPQEAVSSDAAETKRLPGWLAAVMVLGGLAGLVLGGRLFVHSAEAIARMLHVSDKFIAITVLAMGTSLPEFVTSIVALAKRRSQMALGNILGSNVFNILLILGTSALICPMSFASMGWVDMAALALSALMVFSSIYTGQRDRIDRFDGALMLLAFTAYMVWLFIKL